jgi:hypothetical protein
MSADSCIKWEPVGGILAPCADIRFTYTVPSFLSVTMYFSHVRNGAPQDLILNFSGAIALRWESESFGLVPLPERLPRCPDPWSRWTFPLLSIENSTWLDTHHARNLVSSKGRLHFALLSMNDLLHILALPDVKAAWTDSTNKA